MGQRDKLVFFVGLVPASHLLVSWLGQGRYISRRDIPKLSHPTNHGTATCTNRPKNHQTKNRLVPTKTMNTNETMTPTETPEPCLLCGSPSFWRSAYGGKLMCSVCDPWPARAMIGERWTLYLQRDGTAKWVGALKADERAIDHEDPEPISDPDCELEAYEMRDSAGEWFVVEKVR